MPQQIEIETADGACPAGLHVPAIPSAKGVILYMDAFGPRPALSGMADRLADAGYTVLVPDLFYRFGAYGPFATDAFGNETSRQQLMTMIRGTTQAMTESDSGAYIEALTEAGVTGPIATLGYCMGGSRALVAAAAYPERVAAALSFHGGNLASDADDSPHRRAGTIRGRVYVGSAGVDNSFPPEQSARLAEALRSAGIDHMIENYVGMSHGWAVPDHSVYDVAGAERHWKRLLTVLEEALV
ncbi:carboxymethylenebutenolidase [Kaistia soli DSM 19436]|uniref:Carboxymethylenebutenolidase n=1 Tax=Kaistia soli DSM 19436 TaxID=1122133 RepID=A0A1M5DSC5_9HYPH|nr:dienelactone hydrolase family protein [Kaistia soli]SHF69774.1 carboxymethylenebutenolidase [Kaistia soli DSM 19436]